MTETRVLNFRFMERCSGGGHIQIKVYAGYTVGSLGLCGGLVMRHAEWAALRLLLSQDIPPGVPVRVILGELL